MALLKPRYHDREYEFWTQKLLGDTAQQGATRDNKRRQ
jgi:hypothetical protein